MINKIAYYIKEYGLVYFVLKLIQRGKFLLTSLILSKIFKNKIDTDIKEFIKQLSYSKTVVFSLPCLSYGGAELYIRNVAECVYQIDSQINIVFFISDSVGNINSQVLEKNPYIKLFAVRNLTKFSNVLSAKYFVRFIELTKPIILHNTLSESVWRLIRFNHQLVRQHVQKIYISWFTYEVDKDGNSIDFTASYILDCLPQIDFIITDNQHFIDKTRAILSSDLEPEQFNKISTIYNACKLDFKQLNSLSHPLRPINSCQLSFLWIGRLDHQKNISLLYDIAQKMPSADFYVYGSSILGNEFVDCIPSNVHLCGVELDINKIISVRSYTAFILTSLYEGLPNILIEIGYFQIPIIAPNVGGVSELINDDTGFLLSSKPSVENYINAIQIIQGNNDIVCRKSSNLLELIISRHSYPSMKQRLIELNYLNG